MKQGKAKTAFACENCGAVFGKWFGQCPECLAWDSVKEQAISSATATTAALPWHDENRARPDWWYRACSRWQR